MAKHLTRGGTELADRDHDEDSRCRCHEHPGADEPTEVTERKEERTLTAVEMATGEGGHAREFVSCGLRGTFFRIDGFGHRGHQDRAVIEQTVRPQKLEKHVDEDDGENPMTFVSKTASVVSMPRGSVAETCITSWVARRSAKSAADGEQRGRREERGAVLHFQRGQLRGGLGHGGHERRHDEPSVVPVMLSSVAILATSLLRLALMPGRRAICVDSSWTMRNVRGLKTPSSAGFSLMTPTMSGITESKVVFDGGIVGLGGITHGNDRLHIGLKPQPWHLQRRAHA